MQNDTCSRCGGPLQGQGRHSSGRLLCLKCSQETDGIRGVTDPDSVDDTVVAPRPYPWADNPGLCRVLRNPVLWIGAFNEREEKTVLRAMRKLAPMLGLTIPSSASRDLPLWGESLVKVMASVEGRAQLAEEFSVRLRMEGLPWYVFLARRVIQHYGQARKGALPTFEQVCVERKKGYWCLVPSKFAAWLNSVDVSRSDLTNLAGYACAFAILQPDEAPSVLNVLIAKSADFVELLADESLLVEHAAATTNDTDDSEVDLGTGSPDIHENRAECTEDKPTSSEPDKSCAIDWLKTLGDLDTRLTPGGCRATILALEDKARELGKRIQEYDHLVTVAHCQSEKLSHTPWLEWAAEDISRVETTGTDSLASHIERLRTFDHAAIRIIAVLDRLDALALRLHQKSQPIVRLPVADLESVAVSLESHAATLELRLQQIGAWEKRADDFFRQVAQLDAKASLRVLEEVDVSSWRDLFNFLIQGGLGEETRNKYRACLDDHDLLGTMLAYLWNMMPEDVITFTGDILRNRLAADSLSRVNFLSHFTCGQLEQIGLSYPDLSNAVAEAVFVVAVADSNPQLLEYIDPILHTASVQHACAQFYRAAIDSQRRAHIIDPIEDLNPLSLCDRASRQKGRLEKQRDILLNIIDESPGMHGLYRQMRLLARTRFLSPLRSGIAEGSLAETRQRWIQYGTVDDMVAEVESCVVSKRTAVESRHRDQTRRYLEAFNVALQKWICLEREENVEADTDLVDASRNLQQDAKREPEGHSASLCHVMHAVATDTTLLRRMKASIGRLASPGGAISLREPIAYDVVRPQMINGWIIAASEDQVPLAAILCDQLRSAIGVGPRTTKEAVEVLLSYDELQAARMASLGDPILESMVTLEVEKRRDLLTFKYEEVTKEARTIQVYDELIQLCLAEIDESLASLNFKQALGLYAELENLVCQYKVLKDPERQACSLFLSEAGMTCDPNAPLEELLEYVGMLKQEHKERRTHIISIAQVQTRDIFPASAKEQWVSFSHRIDHPSLWPTDEVARSLGSAIDTFVRCMEGKLRFRDVDPDTVDAIVDCLTGWVPEQITAILKEDHHGESTALEAVMQLAKDIRMSAPDALILKEIGALRVRRSESPSQPSSILRGGPEEPVGIAEPGSSSINIKPTRLLPEAKRLIERAIAREEIVGGHNQAELRRICRAQDWTQVRTLSASLWVDEKTIEVFNDMWYVYAVALAHFPGDLDSHELATIFEYLCIGTFSIGDLEYYFDKDYLLSIPARAVCSLRSNAALIDSEENAGPEDLARILQELGTPGASSDVYQWMAELFWNANALHSLEDKVPVSAKLAQNLWDSFTGSVDSARDRFYLLVLLYRLRRMEALRSLARLHGGPLDNLISGCISAFEMAQVKESARATALQLSAAIRTERGRGRTNVKPWVLFFSHLTSVPQESEESPLKQNPAAELVELDESGNARLEIKLVPATYDPPDLLKLDVQGPEGKVTTIALTDEEEALLEERLIQVTLPAGIVKTGDDLTQLAYRVYGNTVRNRPIDVRGTWALQSAGHIGEPLSSDAIMRAWPGASGRPVTSSDTCKGFYGREAEMERIEQSLLAPDRPQSIMVFGQRRVGKTSTLLELARSYPPRNGSLTAAFLDIADLRIPPTGGMASAFYEKILSAIESGSMNEHIRKVLRERCGHRLVISRLVKRANPEISFSDAMERLVDKLSEYSGGVIDRVAFLIDEFDRFV